MKSVWVTLPVRVMNCEVTLPRICDGSVGLGCTALSCSKVVSSVCDEASTTMELLTWDSGSSVGRVRVVSVG